MNTVLSSKVCRVCERDLPVEEFYKRIANKDGYDTMCKDCSRAKRRQTYAEKKGSPPITTPRTITPAPVPQAAPIATPPVGRRALPSVTLPSVALASMEALQMVHDKVCEVEGEVEKRVSVDDYNAMRDQMAELEEDNAAQKQKNAELERKLEEHEQKHAQLTGENEGLTTRLSKLEDVVRALLQEREATMSAMSAMMNSRAGTLAL